MTKGARLAPAPGKTSRTKREPTHWVNGFALGVKHLITVGDLAWVPLEFCCFRMREVDRREIYGNMVIDNPLALCGMIMQAVQRKNDKDERIGCGWIGYCDGRPAGWIAFFENWYGNWQITLGGTDELRFVLLELMKKFYAGVHFAVARGCHRIECRSMADHPEAGRMCKMFGAQLEGRLVGYGKDGTDYNQWAWTGQGLKEAAAKGA